MNFKNQRRWRIILDYAIGWTVAFMFFAIIRGLGTTENGPVKLGWQSGILISLIVGPILGGVSGCAQILTEELIYKRMPIQKLIMIRIAFAIMFLLIMTCFVYGVARILFNADISLRDMTLQTSSLAVYFYVLAIDVFMSLLRQVNLMIGENILLKFLMGKFYTPREEHRVFMFLDLQASTHIAEKLGHIKYSLMIQDCFEDLGVVVENQAEIYQYVGDEAVLTWSAESGISDNNCLRAYFQFRDLLNSRQEYYLKRYNCVPFFKAGIHLGIVTVTEVGKYKKEIAYHGDTINTAARIQGKCNEYNKAILISNDLKDRLSPNGFDFSKIGSVSLRGKSQEVDIFSVDLIENKFESSAGVGP